jgi:hypothetical protein
MELMVLLDDLGLVILAAGDLSESFAVISSSRVENPTVPENRLRFPVDNSLSHT